MSTQDQEEDSVRSMWARRRNMLRAVNRCLVTVYENDRREPASERLAQLLAELGHGARSERASMQRESVAKND